MYSCIKLNKRHMMEFKSLEKLREDFNPLNQDFFCIYDNVNFLCKLFMRRTITILLYKKKPIGYIWTNKDDKFNLTICSMSIINNTSVVQGYKYLINSIKKNNNLTYICEKNHDNYKVLETIGFSKKEGTIEMSCLLEDCYELKLPNNLSLETFKKGIHEKIRCSIQNEAFKNETRVPLTSEDMYFDEIQDYYYEQGSILLKRDNKYIGYGQIIMVDNIPTIVNVGILSEYRGKGYGKILLIHLMNILIANGFKEVQLNVSSTNFTALNLYKSLGFNIKREFHQWELKKEDNI